jgi:hypothetical protein
MQIDSPFITNEMKWGHIADIALMDVELKAFLFSKMTWKEKYFFTSCFLEFPILQKATLIKNLLTVN